MTLNNSDPLAAPLINPNILNVEVDVLVLREGVRSALRFAAAPAWEGYILSPVTLNSDITDAELEAYIHNNGGPGYHAVGTASMSPKGASYGVVSCSLSQTNPTTFLTLPVV